MATKHVFERSYYNNNSDEPNNRVVTLWVNRRREDGFTVWTGGVTFGAIAEGWTTRTAYDGVSWTTEVAFSARATRRRDNAACATLYNLVLTHISTPDVLKDMGVYDAVCADADGRVWE